jgi:hypothetical protein
MENKFSAIPTAFNAIAARKQCNQIGSPLSRFCNFNPEFSAYRRTTAGKAGRN